MNASNLSTNLGTTLDTSHANADQQLAARMHALVIGLSHQFARQAIARRVPADEAAAGSLRPATPVAAQEQPVIQAALPAPAGPRSAAPTILDLHEMPAWRRLHAYL